MGKKSTPGSPLARHPDREAIDRAWGQPATDVAAEFRVDADLVREHRRHTPVAIPKKDCAICQLPLARRLAVETAIAVTGSSNEDVAASFALGDGGAASGLIVRGHRAAGHMLRAAAWYQGKTHPAMLAELEADEA